MLKHSTNRARHLYRLWQTYLSLDKPWQFDKWIAAEMKKETRFGKKDRRFYSDALFAAMRHLLFSLSCAEVLRTEKHLPVDRTALAELLLRTGEKYDSWDTTKQALKAIDPEMFFSFVASRSAVSGQDILPDLRADDSQKIDQAKSALIFHEGTRGTLLWQSIPSWVEPLLAMRSSASSWDKSKTEKFISAHQIRPPLWIRLNSPDHAAECEKEFEENGFSVEKIGDAIALSGEKALYETNAYKSGLIEIQDFASQAIGASCDVHPGIYVWDACAGGGGKTLQIAANLKGKGAVYASDLRSYKLDEVKARARRAGFSNIRTLVWDGKSLPEFPKEISSREGFHRVLVDAPCSSSGTWRRNPDGKYRITPHEVDELSALQFSILSSASRAVRKEGLLIYATCSFFCNENEHLVNKFLESSPVFELVNMQTHGSPAQDSDTTFTAVMKRR